MNRQLVVWEPQRVWTHWRGAVVPARNGINFCSIQPSAKTINKLSWVACYTLPQPAPHTGISSLEAKEPNHTTKAYRCTTEFHTFETSALESGQVQPPTVVPSKDADRQWLCWWVVLRVGVMWWLVWDRCPAHRAQPANTSSQCSLNFLQSRNY
jgi:hypothetical protein